MIALLIQCAIALAILLVVASIAFGSAGRGIRNAGFAIFFGVFALAVVADMLRMLLPVMLRDWRFYVFWFIASPVAYLVLRTRPDAIQQSQNGAPPGQAKRRMKSPDHSGDTRRSE